MTRTFCDICGDEIYFDGEAEHCKVKTRHERCDTFLRYHWEKLTVHRECWRNLCKEIRLCRGDEDVSSD